MPNKKPTDKSDKPELKQDNEQAHILEGLPKNIENITPEEPKIRNKEPKIMNKEPKGKHEKPKVMHEEPKMTPSLEAKLAKGYKAYLANLAKDEDKGGKKPKP